MDTEKLYNTIAIDFGTTNSVAYLYKGKSIEYVTAGELNEQGKSLIPSFVEYTKTGIVVGNAAKNNFGKKNKFVVAAVKRIIGQTYEEYERMKDKSIFGCEVVRGEVVKDDDDDDGYPYFIVSEDGKRVSPIEVASEIFKVMKKRADEYGGREYRQAYVTVPANFLDHQCKAIKKAAELAGLKVLKLITEPTAAAMSWCFDNTDKLNVGENMIVYDFGGGTFDVSLIQYYKGKRFRVRTVNGNPNLGGNDIDSAILDHMVKKCEKVTGVDISKKAGSRRYRSSLRNSCETAKVLITNGCKYDDDESIFLNSNSAINYSLPFSDLDEENVEDIDCTARDLNEAIREKVEETIDIIIHEMKKEKLSVDDIRYVMLVGGSSHLHLIKQLIHKKFINSQFPIMDLNEAVAIGAMKLLMSDSDPNNGGSVEEKIVISYGLQVSGQKVALILKRGEIIPAQSNEIGFTNKFDNMVDIKTSIYQWKGDPSDPNRVKMFNKIPCVPVKECTLIEKLEFKNKYPKPKGEQKLSIRFDLGVGGTLVVRCLDDGKELYVNTFNGVYGCV